MPQHLFPPCARGPPTATSDPPLVLSIKPGSAVPRGPCTAFTLLTWPVTTHSFLLVICWEQLYSSTIHAPGSFPRSCTIHWFLCIHTVVPTSPQSILEQFHRAPFSSQPAAPRVPNPWPPLMSFLWAQPHSGMWSTCLKKE